MKDGFKDTMKEKINKYFFNEFGNEQWISDSLEWNCTCKHGSFGRFSKRTHYPCVCIWNALNKLSWSKIKEAKQKALCRD